MDILTQIFIFILSIAVVVKSSDYFVDAVEKLGLCWRLPHFIMGVVVVAVGTSLPELGTGLASVMAGKDEMLVANVYGSDIANILLGLGFLPFLARKNIKFEQNIFQVHFPIFAIAIALSMLTLMDQKITMWEGLFHWGILMAYLWFLFTTDHKKDHLFTHEFHYKLLIIPVISLLALIIASDLAIDSVINLAEVWGISTTALSATLVAIGTSLPELTVGYKMIQKKHYDMLVGNILGSNIFNILLIIGAGSMIKTLTVSDLTMKIIVPFTIASAYVYWAVSKDKEITKQEGLALTMIYLFFVSELYGII